MQDRKLLWQVLAINALFFIIEIASGIVGNSMGLIADSLDMLADAIVYGLSIYALNGHQEEKKKIAKVSAYFQMLLALIGLAEVVRRFILIETTPNYNTMIVVSIFALVGNSICLYLIQKSKSTDANIIASKIFTSNDVRINVGVIVAGILVYLTSSKIPDLFVGVIVFGIVLKGIFKILKVAK